MASTTTLLATRTKVRERTHYENSQFVTDPELNGMIADSYKELYDLLVASFEGYNVTSTDFAIASGNTFAVPADFYKLQAVDLIVSLPDQFQSLRRVQFNERNLGLRGYDIRANTVYITPFSFAAGQSYRFWYTPTAATLAADSDTFDGIDGWEEYVVTDACLKVYGKSGEDPTVFATEKAAMLARIETMAHSRDENEPMHTSDLRNSSVYGGTYGGRFVDDWT